MQVTFNKVISLLGTEGRTTLHYKVASGHRENFSTFFKPFQLLPPNCLPESPVSIDSESVIQIKIGPLLVGVFRC